MIPPRIRQGQVFGVLNGGITNVATTIAITPDAGSGGLPAVAAPYIMALILEPDTANEEVVWITSCAATAVSGIIVMRGQETTLNVAHLNGVPYKHGPTLLDYPIKQIQDHRWATGAATVNDDEFDGGVLDGSWTQVVPSGTQSVLVGNDTCSVKVKGTTAGSACGLVKPLNGFGIGNSIETAVRYLTSESYLMTGPLLCDGLTAGSNYAWMSNYSYPNSILQLQFYKGTFTTAVGSGSPGISGIITGPLFSKIKWVAANSFQPFWSPDGVQWTDFGLGAQSITLTPTYMGFGTSSYGGAQDVIASYEYFRVV